MRRWILVLAAVLLTALAVITPPWPDLLESPADEPDPTATGPETLLGAEDSTRAPRLHGRAGQDPPDAEPLEEDRRRLLLTGTAIEDETWEPLQGVRVRLGRALSPVHGTEIAQDTHSWFVEDPVTKFVAERITGADGRFSFPIEGLRGWALCATKEGYSEVVRTTNHRETGTRGGAVQLELRLYSSQSIRLQVVDTADQPVPGATVAKYSYECNRPPSERTSTDENGWFAISASKDDVLVVRAAGFARIYVDEILDRGGAPIVLPAPYALGGIVVDDADAPIEGALVWADREHVPVRVTDASGRFAWSDLPLDPRHERVDVTAWTPDHLSRGELAIPGQTDLRIVLFRPGALAGRIVFPESGDARPTTLRVNGPGNFTQRSSGHGSEFRLTEIPPGKMSITAEAFRPIHVQGKGHAVRAFEGRLAVERLPGVDIEDLTIWLERVEISYVVSRVVDSEGRPIQGGGHNIDSAWGGATSRRTDANGVIFTAVAVPPGTQTTVSPWAIVRVRNGTRQVQGEAVPVRTVADPESEPVEIVLHKDPAKAPGRVRLTLFTERADGVPLPAGAAANWTIKQPGGLPHGSNPAVTPPGPEGRRWRGVLAIAAGVETEVIAWASGCANRSFKLPAFAPGEAEFVCRLKPESRIRGRLVTQTGQPASAHPVHATVHPPGEPRVQGRQVGGGSALDGTFLLERIAAGSAHVRVTRPWPNPTILAEVTCRVAEGVTVDLGDIVLGALPVLQGTVRDTSGRTLGGVLIALFDGTDRESYAQTSTRGDGRFEFRAAYRTHARMHVSRSDHPAHIVALEKSAYDAPQHIRLQPWGTVIVLGPRPPGEVTRWWLAPFEGKTGHFLGSRGPGQRVDDGLRWMLTRLPIGPVRFELTGTRPDGTRWMREAKGAVVAGQTTTVRFEREE